MDRDQFKRHVAGLTGAEFFELVKVWVGSHREEPDGTLEDLIRAGTAFMARHWGACESLAIVGRVSPDDALTLPVICRASAPSS